MIVWVRSWAVLIKLWLSTTTVCPLHATTEIRFFLLLASARHQRLGGPMVPITFHRTLVCRHPTCFKHHAHVPHCRALDDGV